MNDQTYHMPLSEAINRGILPALTGHPAFTMAMAKTLQKRQKQAQERTP